MLIINFEMSDKPTPNGGSYSIAYWQDENNNPTIKEKAVKAEIIEFNKDNQEIARFYMTIGNQNKR